MSTKIQRFPTARAWRRMVCLSCAIAIGGAAAARGTQPEPEPEVPDGIRVEQIAPRYHLISDHTANILLLATDEGSLVAGVQRPSLIDAAKATIARLKAGPIRFAAAMEDSLAEHYDTTLARGDGGWRREGAITIMHEAFRRRMEKFGRDKLANPMPLISFSHVVQMFLANEDVHWIHERRGYTDADIVIHFEKEGLLHLGNVFTSDGYPAIDQDRRGSVDGLIETVEFFLEGFKPGKVEPIVPARGPVATLQDLQMYRDMLVVVRDRVSNAIASGRTRDDIIAAKPTRELDARWGHGAIAADRFVEMVYDSLIGRKPVPPTPTAPQHDHQR